MIWEAWFTLVVIGLTVIALIQTRSSPDHILCGSLAILLIAGILPAAEALSGFANPGLATVAALYVVATGLIETGALHNLNRRMLGQSTERISSQLRLMLPVTAMSAFFNNTPVVAMLVPAVQEWCRKLSVPVSRYMIPLSFAAILGGTCTLIGTSTNLVVHGLVLKETELGSMGFFEIGWVGLPCAVIGTLFVVFGSPYLLPREKESLLEPKNVREYLMEMLVEPRSVVVGKTIDEAGLRHLQDAYVMEIIRGDIVRPVVGPTERIAANDRLVFVGAVNSLKDLLKVKGLVPAADQVFKIDLHRTERKIVEAVISESSPVIGKTIRDSSFRTRYQAVVIAVARNGERLKGKVGDIVLRPGDILVMETLPGFIEQEGKMIDFLLVSELQSSATPRHEKAWLALGILGLLIILSATGMTSVLKASFLAAVLMVATGCTSGEGVRRSMNWPVLLSIGASVGLGHALQITGASSALVQYWMDFAGHEPWLTLAVIYTLTSVLTSVITNNAAAVLIFPVAQVAAQDLQVSFWPFVIAIMMAASASFATPISYQTNLMVYGPGGYRFSDYIRIGLPLNILLGVITLGLIPFIWPF